MLFCLTSSSTSNNNQITKGFSLADPQDFLVGHLGSGKLVRRQDSGSASAFLFLGYLHQIT